MRQEYIQAPLLSASLLFWPGSHWARNERSPSSQAKNSYLIIGSSRSHQSFPHPSYQGLRSPLPRHEVRQPKSASSPAAIQANPKCHFPSETRSPTHLARHFYAGGPKRRFEMALSQAALHVRTATKVHPPPDHQRSQQRFCICSSIR